MKFRVLWDYSRVITLKLTEVSEVRTAPIIRAMMEAVPTSETSVHFTALLQDKRKWQRDKSVTGEE
jgi:hypothetical protein